MKITLPAITPGEWNPCDSFTGIGTKDHFLLDATASSATEDENGANIRAAAALPELLSVVARLVDVCANGNPMQLIQQLGEVNEAAQAALLKAGATIED